jgi:protein-L-isoaspartate(D-aspartate) O-methyltransferase
VHAVQGDGTRVDFDPADVIYVNAGATRPVDLWLDRLKDGGRMILALTRDKDAGGAFFLVERRGEGFRAKWLFSAGLFPCEGARDRESARALVAALKKGGWDRVTRLYRRGDVPEEQCWLKGPDWCLAYD